MSDQPRTTPDTIVGYDATDWAGPPTHGALHFMGKSITDYMVFWDAAEVTVRLRGGTVKRIYALDAAENKAEHDAAVAHWFTENGSRL